jgi:hypothetical protein
MNKALLIFLMSAVFNYALFAQDPQVNNRRIIITADFNANDVAGAHHKRPLSERFPLVLTMPDGKLVWLGGIIDKYRVFNYRTSASFPFASLSLNDSLRVRIRAVNMRNKKLNQWESQVYFDTTMTLPQNINNGSVLLIKRNRKGVISFQWNSPEDKRYSWFIRREPNGVWDGVQLKTFVEEKYVPKQLRSDERFITEIKPQL